MMMMMTMMLIDDDDDDADDDADDDDDDDDDVSLLAIALMLPFRVPLYTVNEFCIRCYTLLAYIHFEFDQL